MTTKTQNSKEKRSKKYESLEFITKVIKHSPTGISVYDSTGQCVSANDSICEMVGATKEQVLTQNIYTIESWKKTGLLEAAQEALSSKKVSRIEFNYITSFRKKVYLDCSFVPFNSEGEEFLLLILSDITQIREANEELLIKSAALDSTVTGIAISDLDGKVTYSNDSSHRIFGLEEDTRGQSVFNFFSDKNQVQEVIEVLKTKGSWEGELLGNKKDGEEIVLKLHSNLVFNEKGEPICMMASYVDITNEKLAAEEIRKSLITRSLVGSMLNDLVEVGNLTSRDVFLAGKKLSKSVSEDTLDGFLAAFSDLGLGDIKIGEIDESNGRWIFKGSNLVEKFANSKKPTCNYTLGFLSSALSKLLNYTNIAGVELECQSTGDEYCKFVIQKRKR